MKNLLAILFLFFCLFSLNLHSQKKIKVPKERGVYAVFSDGQNYGYLYRIEKEGVFSTITEYWYNYNGKDYGPFDDNVDHIVWSPDRNKVAFSASLDNQYYDFLSLNGGYYVGSWFGKRSYVYYDEEASEIVIVRNK